MTAARTVLMCGGPADGRWVAVPPGTHDWYVIKSPTAQWVPAPVDPVGPALDRVLYRIMPVTIMGHELWVGVAVDEAYDDRAVMKAILQRDVASHLGAYR